MSTSWPPQVIVQAQNASTQSTVHAFEVECVAHPAYELINARRLLSFALFIFFVDAQY